MLCQNCNGRTASVLVRRIRNGELEERYLCQQCAAQLGYHDLSEKMGTENRFHGYSSPQQQEMRCPSCGMSFDEISAEGKLGCAMCYTVFQAQLEPLLLQAYDQTGHAGKVPFGASQKAQKDMRTEELRRLLSEAIESQNFEKATKLWNELRQQEESEAVK